ncbi:DUF2913 family protein [Photobacterium lutimaris]|uniref:DUF2913 domain-containing protein n=1 Tax=Photobacterium lutimaris TaxID=388278 RepID=A0A2T3IQ75_9GAMM|nr:DUF2913 family protein [Photobacterium lutimaris]PSU30498.1 DUF2913 domain-containing protein [Photobacterium lutimaris]TDR76061.1 DUF2913 family protein [Photobacterium lutimaris]
MNQTQQLLDVSTNALLHLEFQKLDKHLTLAERNNILVKYFKRIAKSNRYRTIRKSAKQWIAHGRHPDGDLESVLNNEVGQLIQTCSTDLYRFVGLIDGIESKLKTKVQYSKAHDIDLNARYGKVLVCVVDEDLTSSFDEDGLMIKSTQVLFIGDTQDKDVFSEAIEQDGNFQSVIAYEDDNHLRVELFRM